MNPIRTIRRLARMPGGLVPALAFAAPVPAAYASLPPHRGRPADAHTTVRVIATGGMTGWQITVIVAAAALLAAALVVTAYRTRATRRRVTASPA
jgi:hypothetical protein